jgi:hypothetical protein
VFVIGLFPNPAVALNIFPLLFVPQMVFQNSQFTIHDGRRQSESNHSILFVRFFLDSTSVQIAYRPGLCGSHILLFSNMPLNLLPKTK